MKKSLLAVVAALAMAGCSQNDLVDEIDNGGQISKAEIKVSPYIGKNSRAADFTTLTKYTVFSYITTGNYNSTNGLGDPYMNVTYTNTNNVWTNNATKKYYWPTGNNKLQFFAYPDDITANVASTGYPSINSADGKDIVVAHAADMTSESQGVNNGTITLNFKHILTRINFSFIPEEENIDYTITGLSIAGIKTGTGGIYTFDDTKGSWNVAGVTTTSEKTAYSVLQSAEKTQGKDYYHLGDTNASLMLYPQDASGATITIEYSTKVSNPSMEIFKGSKTVTLPDNTIWEVGQNINYVLTLPVGGTEATVQAEVNAWDSATDKLL